MVLLNALTSTCLQLSGGVEPTPVDRRTQKQRRADTERRVVDAAIALIAEHGAAGQSPADVGRRVRVACDELWAEASETDVVVVSHVTPIKAAVAWTLGVGDGASWRMFLDTASVCQIGTGRAGPALRTFNETHHRPSS